MNPDQIRSLFSKKMSEMYRDEVPAYGDLCDLVKDINESVLKNNPQLRAKLESSDNLDRISEERHGAIRLGKPEELTMIAKLFVVMGMEPVSYYDLSANGVPVHSTAFRPITKESLSISPFRVFTSLLRAELIQDDDLREKAEDILKSRDIFSIKLRDLINKAEHQGHLNENDAKIFIAESINVFRWHKEAAVDAQLYSDLKKSHTLIADVVSFKGPHINHLTPRCLDIDALQKRMPERGINPKAVIEGPPGNVAILLRQTSFKALTEPVLFNGTAGEHTARFGEVEQRGAALTPKGRALYDETLGRVLSRCKPAADASNREEYNQILREEFDDFPSDFLIMISKGLAYCDYHLSNKIDKIDPLSLPENMDSLIESGLVEVSPIVYEDFLPASAAGIFQSNLGDDAKKESLKPPSQKEFETILGRPVYSEFELYEKQQNQSADIVLKKIRRLKVDA